MGQTGVDLKDNEALLQTVEDILRNVDRAGDAVSDKLRQLDAFLEECTAEEHNSRALLEDAKIKEQEALTALRIAEAAYAAACAAKVGVSAARAWMMYCRYKYKQAVEHRKRMERRYSMAVRCRQDAQALLSRTEDAMKRQQALISSTSAAGCSRLKKAKAKTDDYLSDVTPQMNAYKEWRDYEPPKDRPVNPVDIRSRLNPSKDVQLGLLHYLMQNQKSFKEQIERYREEGPAAELKVRRNLAGRLAEEITINAFRPYGETVVTQECTYFAGGDYTKTDLKVYDLEVPIILGRGTGMAAREGSNIAIEVKAGKSAYLQAQKEHMKFQAQGHSGSDASWVICTRDIKNMPAGSEQELRGELREAGSPVVGMLPAKEELDAVCLEFVFGGKEHV